MKHTLRSVLLSLTAAVLTLSTSLPGPIAHAADTPVNGTGQALEIAPPVINLSADPGQSVGTEISLRDVSSTNLLVTSEVNDFVASGEDGTPKILTGENQTSPYSMKSWISALPQLTLKSRQIERLPVKINVPKDAAPGGYYAVIRFTAVAPDNTSQGLSLSASLGALVLLKVNGDAKEELKVEQFSAIKSNGASSSLFESAPITFVERLKNSGTVHEQPSGSIAITNMFGKKIANVNVNLPPRNILPNSIRRFEQKLDSSVIGNTMLFGRYTATLKLSYGTNGQTITDTVTFWVIPYTLILIIVIGLIALFFILKALMRRYNSHIVKSARPKRRRW